MKEKIENERFLLLQQQMPFVSLGNSLAGLGLIAMLWHIIPQHILLLWYVLLLVFWGTRGFYSYLENKHPPDAFFVAKKKENFIICFLLSLVCFGVVQGSYFSPQNQQFI
jgi:hypothetical protein